MNLPIKSLFSYTGWSVLYVIIMIFLFTFILFTPLLDVLDPAHEAILDNTLAIDDQVDLFNLMEHQQPLTPFSNRITWLFLVFLAMSAFVGYICSLYSYTQILQSSSDFYWKYAIYVCIAHLVFLGGVYLFILYSTFRYILLIPYILDPLAAVVALVFLYIGGYAHFFVLKTIVKAKKKVSVVSYTYLFGVGLLLLVLFVIIPSFIVKIGLFFCLLVLSNLAKLILFQ
ncbi:MAG: hypothetical protein ACMXYC_03345 [Candidatus Woesearchaeota archaeon]